MKPMLKTSDQQPYAFSWKRKVSKEPVEETHVLAIIEEPERTAKGKQSFKMSAQDETVVEKQMKIISSRKQGEMATIEEEEGEETDSELVRLPDEPVSQKRHRQSSSSDEDSDAQRMTDMRSKK